MPRRKEQCPDASQHHVRVEIIRADTSVIDPRDGRAELPLVICVLNEDGPIGVRLIFSKDFRQPRRGR